MAPRTTKSTKRTPSDSLPSRSMKDSAGPSHPLPLKPHSTTTTTPKKRKLPDTSPTQTTPTTTTRRLNGHNSQGYSPTGSVASSVRSTVSRRGDVPINDFPVRRTEKCDVYVFGAGSMGELGLGPRTKDRNVKRPRLNVHLSEETMGDGEKGIVDVAVGGMHVAAVDSDGGVWTWGVNDQGSLGRDTKTGATTEEVSMKDGQDSDDDEEDEELLNLAESKPGLVQGFPKGVKVVQMACGDSISVAIADDGLVYSWGTFRASDGVLGYSKNSLISPRPTPITTLPPYTVSQISCGTDHVLALTTTGRVYAWGNGQQFQMGRRVIERSRSNGLIPRPLALSKIKLIGTGAYHSFAVNLAGEVFAWGLNQFGQCGVGEGGTDGASITTPTLVEGLSGQEIIWIGGGEHHSLAVTKTGKVFAWGRLDIHQLGIARGKLPSTALPQPNPRYLPVPTVIPDIPPMVFAACGTHHNIAISDAGETYSWGYGESYQVGHGPSAGDVEVPTKIENTATKGVKMITGGAGGQFSVLLGLPKEKENGA